MIMTEIDSVGLEVVNRSPDLDLTERSVCNLYQLKLLSTLYVHTTCCPYLNKSSNTPHSDGP